MPSVEIREIRCDAERTAAFRLRYDVFCRQKKWIPAAACAGGLECNEYDDAATHLIAVEAGRVVGTVRLIRQSERPFPMERSFPRPPHEFMGIDAWDGRIAEVSRLVVSGSNQPIGAISLGLLQAIFRKSLSVGVEVWLSAMDVPARRMVWGRFGFPNRQYAATANYMGSASVPSAQNLLGNLQHFRQTNARMFDYFSHDVSSRSIVQCAISVLERKQMAA